MGSQRVGFSEALRALSREGRDNEIRELCLFWKSERAGVRLVNIPGSKVAGMALETPPPVSTYGAQASLHWLCLCGFSR